MLNNYYAMTTNPFNKELDVKNAFLSEDYKEVLARLKYLTEVKGLGIITGGSGVGKTFAIRSFVTKLSVDLYKIIYLTANNFSLFNFYKTITDELHIDIGACYLMDTYKKIQEEIKRIVDKEKRNIVIIIDEAQRLKKEILQELHLFYDFEMDSKNYITLILVGNNNIKTELKKECYATLRQRILMSYELEGISKEEVKEYIKTRLEIANVRAEIFTEDAFVALHACASTSIRVLNQLIMTSLLLGMQEEKNEINGEIVRKAREEIFLY